MTLETGLERMLYLGTERLAGRRFALLAHGASLSSGLIPTHLVFTDPDDTNPSPAALLIGAEHGFYGVEQDMIPAAGGTDPWTGAPIVSLYGDSAGSLRPAPGLFDDVDLLVIDLQDVGSRYYTYAATAVWAAEAALAAGREVWVLDRPNPLGGERVEGPLVRPGFHSFVGAFAVPVRHGLTLGELVRLEAYRRGWPEGLTVWRMSGWERRPSWEEVRHAWIAPSPNMPTLETAYLYPGLCLVEATELSEGRGTTRPFRLVGAPGVHPVRLWERLRERWFERLDLGVGVAALPCYFRPQFQKHAGEVCGGVELVVTDRQRLRPFRAGIELLAALAEAVPDAFAWRDAPYEFVTDRPAIDLLTGSADFRKALESGQGLDEWIESWHEDEVAFLEERRPALLYPEPGEVGGSFGAVR